MFTLGCVVWVESWVVKFCHEHSVFTLGCVGYKFGLSLGWLNFWPKCSVFTLVGVGYKFELRLGW